MFTPASATTPMTTYTSIVVVGAVALLLILILLIIVIGVCVKRRCFLQKKTASGPDLDLVQLQLTW